MRFISARSRAGAGVLAVMVLGACSAPLVTPLTVTTAGSAATTVSILPTITAPSTPQPTLVPTGDVTVTMTAAPTVTLEPTVTITAVASKTGTATITVVATTTGTATGTAAVPTAPTKTVEPSQPVQPGTAPQTVPPAQGLVMPRGSIRTRPWMVMIDNHPGAYPQSGMDKAAIIFEGLAEFGISRYIATFADGWTPDAAEIGPIRSTRAYFAQWAMGFHPLYVHAGGSPDGLELVQSTDQLVNVDALNQAVGSYRDTTRLAPHNLYTSAALLRRFAVAHGVSTFADGTVGYLYAKAAPLAQVQATTLNYYFLDQGSAAGFVYSPRDNVYYRNVFGHPHLDRLTGAQLRTSNVVVMAVTGSARPGDEKSRIDQNVVGSGQARVFKDGGLINATWTKSSAAAPLRFYDAAGNEIVFSNGSIWIAAIPSLDRLSIR